MRFALGSMTVADILDRALALLLERFGTLYGLNAMAATPYILAVLAAPVLEALGLLPVAAMIQIGGSLVTLALTPLANAAQVHILQRGYCGERVPLREALRFGAKRIADVLIALMLAGLLVALGFACCLLPGVFAVVVYYVVVQAATLEGLNGPAALTRSAELTQGHRLRLLGLALLMFAAYLVANAGTIGLFVLMPPFEIIIGRDGMVTQKVNSVNNAVFASVATLLNSAFQAWATACATMVYLDLRARKEGYDLDLAMEAAGQEIPAALAGG